MKVEIDVPPDLESILNLHARSQRLSLAQAAEAACIFQLFCWKGASGEVQLPLRTYLANSGLLVTLEAPEDESGQRLTLTLSQVEEKSRARVRVEGKAKPADVGRLFGLLVAAAGTYAEQFAIGLTNSADQADFFEAFKTASRDQAEPGGSFSVFREVDP